ncbi:poly-gamma-glutamate hydrolase family protein [Halobacillus sp. BBL2006]|uniref:poly-gamma-glutamate hydrolase family protein n=1 Tax=Halobacillus sp. BBL2006 TaxID=1543706 RepID=UPI00068A9D63|nr:poly-gamma-glutamate hydrolase family protein [Halobacillus sp. BBL2006]
MSKVLIVSAVIAAALAAATLFIKNESVENDEECSSSDRFCSFEELKRVYSEGEDWEIQTRDSQSDRMLVSAIHGGGIEQATTQLADAIAGDEYDYYTFKGKLSSGNFENLHITSIHFDEPEALNMVHAVDHHISIHGAKGEEPKTFIGGLNEDLRKLIAQHLKERGFAVEEAAEHLNGDHPENIVNQSKAKQGVQLELTREQREAFYKNGDISYSSRSKASNQTEAFKRYVKAIRAAIVEYEQ